MVLGVILVCIVAGLAAVYWHDKHQQVHTVLRNFPVIGHVRYFTETWGDAMRQYQYLPDWAERPFNRLERSWVYRSAKGVSNLVSFVFRNAAFPVLDEEKKRFPGKLIGVASGPGACAHPYMGEHFFNISGMSYGALSHAAVSALSRGAKMAGVWMGTGEGGLSSFHLEGGADIIMQIGTAKYGVRDANGALSEARLREIAALPQVKMFEVKLAQGAKPGKGGVLPAAKVTAEIAAIRGIPQGVDPDYVQVDGGEGGTGAAPEPLADYVGLPITQALPYVVALRDEHGLTGRIRVIAAGKLITPDKVAWALCNGADFVNSARGFMFSLGCIQAMKCGSGRCPTGVTAADPRLIAGLDPADKAVRVSRYAARMIEEVEMIAHSCGLTDASGFKPRHVTEIERGVGGFRAHL